MRSPQIYFRRLRGDLHKFFPCGVGILISSIYSHTAVFGLFSVIQLQHCCIIRLAEQPEVKFQTDLGCRLGTVA